MNELRPTTAAVAVGCFLRVLSTHLIQHLVQGNEFVRRRQSRQDLANFSGTTLETAIRTISRFTNEQLVRTERGGHLVLLNEKRLRELAQSG